MGWNRGRGRARGSDGGGGGGSGSKSRGKVEKLPKDRGAERTRVAAGLRYGVSAMFRSQPKTTSVYCLKTEYKKSKEIRRASG